MIRTLFRILLGAGLIFAGIGHLTFARTEFRAQVPPWLPMDPDFVVIASGLVEILLGLGLEALPKYAKPVGLFTGIFFVVVFPGNLAQFLEHRDAFGLNTDAARGIRLAFQPLLVLWAFWCTQALTLWRPRQESNLRLRD